MKELRVFIADDSAIICGRLLTLLSDIEGVQVLGFAQTAEDASKNIAELQPEIVILDIRMPGGNGIEVLEMLKTKFPAMKIIMFTNYPYAQYKERCIQAGANYFFDKSSEFFRISEVLQELVQQREKADFSRPS